MLDVKWKYIFKDIDENTANSSGEIAVHCPIPEHIDTNPSAHLNVDKNIVHCKTCDKAWNLKQLIKGKESLFKFINNNNIPTSKWDEFPSVNQSLYLTLSQKWGFDINVLQQLQVKHLGGINDEFSVPYFTTLLNKNVYIGHKTYTPTLIPKWKNSINSQAGYIFPFQVWEKDNKPTLICAGEKDVLIARSKGFNAITLMGGELSLPLEMSFFKGRDIIIAYDNDEAGKKGAINLANHLGDLPKSIKILTNIYQYIPNKGGDIFDFFQNYTASHLLDLINKEALYIPEKIDKYANLKTVNKIQDILKPENSNRWIKSNVKVISSLSEAYAVPISFIADITTKQGLHFTYEWELDETNIALMLKLLENQLLWNKLLQGVALSYFSDKYEEIRGLTKKEYVLNLRILKKGAIQRFMFSEGEVDEGSESSSNQAVMIGCICNHLVKEVKIEANQEIEIIHKPLQEGDKKAQLVAVIKDYRNSSHFLDNFEITPAIIKSLNKFKVFETLNETVESKLTELWERAKNFTKKFIEKELFLATELTFNSPWQITYGKEIIKAPLDVLIIGDTQVGKSTTAEGMIHKYQNGIIRNLSSSTTISLIGGQRKSGGKEFTTIGALPANNRKLVVMEEFSTALSKQNGNMSDFIETFRNTRSSGKVHISRANGEIKAPCVIRSIILTNPKHDNVSVETYPKGGYGIIKDLGFKSPDIARFTFAMITLKRPHESEFAEPKFEMFDSIDYKNRLQWAWTRNKEHIVISEEIQNYINKFINKYNTKYAINDLPLIGSNFDTKILKVAVAVATTLCSTEDNVNVIVKKEHVDFALTFFDSIYGDKPFKLNNERKKINEYNAEAGKNKKVQEELQKRMVSDSTVIERLIEDGDTTIRNLEIFASKTKEEFQKFLHWLVEWKFVKIKKENVEATDKLKTAFELVNTSEILDDKDGIVF